MNILDDLSKINGIDPKGMLEVEEKFYGQLMDAKKIAENTGLGGLVSRKFSGVAILGMGGSGFSGDIIKELVRDEIKVPVEVVKGYNLPACVTEDWLVVPVSYSGNTEETISAASEAILRNCSMMILCSGGKLEALAREKGLVMIKIPSGLQPRGAIGYIFFPVYLALGIMGLVRIPADEIEEALALVKEKAALYNRNTESSRNPAKKIALAAQGLIPIVYGTEGILSAVAYRLKCEFNENSKTPGWCNTFPELNHNETVGWENLKNITRNFIIIAFRDPGETIRMKTRMDVTLKQVKENVSAILEIPVEGKSRLARTLFALYLGDIASVYLALLYGTDPTPVYKIESLKAELAKID
ncbi:MAG: bifunctional phosphoglucose/phosphomannose isomerase [Actinobacteria bacterium]|nr:bifunctional phosphoglucose/phosphomannose isomerase [Actinomycetota bacterium]